MGPGNEKVQVLTATRRRAYSFMRLQTENGDYPFTVTADHSVVVEGLDGQQTQIEAGMLAEQDPPRRQRIFDGEAFQEVVEATKFTEKDRRGSRSAGHFPRGGRCAGSPRRIAEGRRVFTKRWEGGHRGHFRRGPRSAGVAAAGRLHSRRPRALSPSAAVAVRRAPPRLAGRMVDRNTFLDTGKAGWVGM